MQALQCCYKYCYLWSSIQANHLSETVYAVWIGFHNICKYRQNLCQAVMLCLHVLPTNNIWSAIWLWLSLMGELASQSSAEGLLYQSCTWHWDHACRLTSLASWLSCNLWHASTCCFWCLYSITCFLHTTSNSQLWLNQSSSLQSYVGKMCPNRFCQTVKLTLGAEAPALRDRWCHPTVCCHW